MYGTTLTIAVCFGGAAVILLVIGVLRPAERMVGRPGQSRGYYVAAATAFGTAIGFLIVSMAHRPTQKYVSGIAYTVADDMSSRRYGALGPYSFDVGGAVSRAGGEDLVLTEVGSDTPGVTRYELAYADGSYPVCLTVEAQGDTIADLASRETTVRVRVDEGHCHLAR